MEWTDRWTDGWKDGRMGGLGVQQDQRTGDEQGGGEDPVHVRKLENCEDADNTENTHDQAVWWTVVSISLRKQEIPRSEIAGCMVNLYLTF